MAIISPLFSQIPLPLVWPDQATFQTFYPENNQLSLAHLQKIGHGDTQLIYLHGACGVGLSHLLYATCHAVQQRGKTASYLPLKNSVLSTKMLEGMENLSLICWDDIESVAGKADWEEALFHCYNRVQATGASLLIAGHLPPHHIPWQLADLKSRLAACTVFTIHPLSDEGKIRVLQGHAKRRGLDLSDEVGRYLLSHSPRGMNALLTTLEQLDHFSLATQRRLTIPFVKEILNK